MDSSVLEWELSIYFSDSHPMAYSAGYVLTADAQTAAFQIHEPESETGAYKPAERLLTYIKDDVTASN
jgi:hypothetical protein